MATARYYRLTAAGRKQLGVGSSAFARDARFGIRTLGRSPASALRQD